MQTLQEQINKAKKGEVLELQYGGEYNEQVTIKKPITLKAISSPIVLVGDEPSLTIASKNVRIENAIIESRDLHGVSIVVRKNCGPVFKNVFVTGVVKTEEEKGPWEYPSLLELPLKPEEDFHTRILIHSPIPSRIVSETSSVKISPSQLKSGLNEIEIHVGYILKNTYFTGDLIIEAQKSGLKRKISLLGNTFNSECGSGAAEGKYLWVCEASKSRIDTRLIAKLPKGNQDAPYQYIIEKKVLNALDYTILSVKGLPKGLRFDGSGLFPQIKGKPKEHGDFPLVFSFQKEDQAFDVPSQIKIAEPLITPLTVASLPDPIDVIQKEPVSLKFEILSSNVTDIRYEAVDPLPNCLFLDKETGTLSGAFTEHGDFSVKIKISDKTNELNQQLHFHVAPKNPLSISLKKNYRYFQNTGFEIPLDIDDADGISPKLKLREGYGALSIEQGQNSFLLKGRLRDIRTYPVEILIQDKYKRRAIAKTTIDCIKQRIYVSEWHTEFPLSAKGNKSSSFTKQLKAGIKGKPGQQLKFELISLSKEFSLSEQGLLKGRIDGKNHRLEIRIFTEDWQENKEIEVITIADNSNIINSSLKAFSQNSIFNLTPSKEEDLPDADSVPAQLPPGTAYKSYKAYLTKTKAVSGPQDQKITGLPQGLVFYPDKMTIEGIPTQNGTFSLKIYDAQTNVPKTVSLEIKTNIFHQLDRNSQKSSPDKSNHRKKKRLLGGAFMNSEKNNGV